MSGFIRGSQEASATYFDKSNAQGFNASLLDLQVGLKLGGVYISYTSSTADGIIKNMYIMYINKKCICLPAQLNSWEVKCKSINYDLKVHH